MKNNRVYSLLSVFCLLLSAFCLPQDTIAKAKKSDYKTKTTVEEAETKQKKEPINESDFEPVLIGALLDKPDTYVGKKIKFRGKFSSFTTLALDYEPALRKAKDYISLCIFRTDSMIPLSELKLAYPVKEAKENQVIRELEEGDFLEINGEVFSAALDEPWVDILSIKKLESASKNSLEKVAEEKSKSQDLKPNKETKKKNKKVPNSKDK